MEKKKKLYMIGNSHIDPVWFWNWDEGMQEVKATFASVLDRMKEYEEFKFTSTSSAFFEWIEKTVPSMFEEIKARVAQGRWELTGGWFIEPDCNLPCGEAFARQGLYAQRYFQNKFGKICNIGSNVDSFGHGPNLPQFLKKSGMDHYVLMRPKRENPVFLWESNDGSCVNAISLPGEYTTWFHEPTRQNMEITLAAVKNTGGLPCCYGVGNHGGGPTRENIESILALRSEFQDTAIEFSTFEEFFHEFDLNLSPETLKQPFEKVNTGCYAMDAKLKKMNRLSEIRSIQTDTMLSMAAGKTGKWLPEAEKMQNLWKRLIFNQFHDILGGTAIKEARDEAVMQFCAVCAESFEIKTLAMQAMVNHLDTRGTGFPLFLFHTGGEEFHGYVNAELNWFCKDPLKVLGPDGNEIAYQRVHTKAKVRNYVLGGRRNIVFFADIPSCGYAIYRLSAEEPKYCFNPHMELEDDDPYEMENELIKITFDKKSGLLNSILDKKSGYDAINSTVSYQIWQDERDTWGGMQDRPYQYTNENMKLVSIEKVESGKLRQCIRAVYAHGGSQLEQLYYLYAGEEELLIENHLFWDKRWHSLKIGFPTGIKHARTRAEGSYTTIPRPISDEDEYYMQRFLDVSNELGEGLAISNDSKYCFGMQEGTILLTAARSSIYAQGNGKEWYNPLETYEHADLGKDHFTLLLRPHKKELSVPRLYRMAERINGAYDYLADSCHAGEEPASGTFSLASTDQSGVRIMIIKKAEDDNDYIVRILETEGLDRKYQLTLSGNQFSLTIGHHEIQTLKINLRNRSVKQVNLLEYEI